MYILTWLRHIKLSVFKNGKKWHPDDFWSRHPVTQQKVAKTRY